MAAYSYARPAAADTIRTNHVSTEGVKRRALTQGHNSGSHVMVLEQIASVASLPLLPVKGGQVRDVYGEGT